MSVHAPFSDARSPPRQDPALPELIIPAALLKQSCFQPGTAFMIHEYDHSLVLRVVNNTEEGQYFDDWVRENGDVYLSGSWLENGDLTGCQAVNIGLQDGSRLLYIQPQGRIFWA